MSHTRLEVAAESRPDVEFLGRTRCVVLRLGEEHVTMPLEVAHSVAAAIEQQCKLIEDDYPFEVVFK